MNTSLTWHSDEYSSTEHCIVRQMVSGYEILSNISGRYEDKAFEAKYLIATNNDWQTTLTKVRLDTGNKRTELLFVKNDNGTWYFDGRPDERFDGCIDVDIPLTPFTNTLPVNRLKMAIGGSELIKVIYIDVFEGIRTVQQKYTRLSASTYKYENVPNDFEAVITMDDAGFILEYPGLFRRV